MLTRVTITGADDLVDPADLAALSAEFPFVEWGILFSAKRVGTSRYPSTDWTRRLKHVARPAMHLSAHLCGRYVHALSAGAAEVIYLFKESPFSRIQLNGFTGSLDTLRGVAEGHAAEFIIQVGQESNLSAWAHADTPSIRVSALFDPSGGRGIEAFRWPRPVPGLRLGYAGGIKPSNVLDVLRDIGPVEQDFWIDMESGVRTNDDRLDLGLVREVLEKTAPFVGAPLETPQ